MEPKTVSNKGKPNRDGKTCRWREGAEWERCWEGVQKVSSGKRTERECMQGKRTGIGVGLSLGFSVPLPWDYLCLACCLGTAWGL